MENIKKNYLYQIAYQFLSIIIPIITAPYIARVLGTRGVGIYSYTYSIVYYFVLFAKLGINIYGNRIIAIVRKDKERLNKTFTEILIVHVIVSVFVVAFYCLFLSFCSIQYKKIFAIQSLYICAELIEINWFFFGLEKFDLTAARNIFIKIMTMICIFLFVKTGEDVWKYCAILAISAVFSELIMWLSLSQYVKLTKITIKDAKKHIRPLIILFIPYIAVSLYKVMDKIMLGVFANFSQVGLYQNSESITSMALSLITALGTVMLPRMSSLVSEKSLDQSKKIIYMSMEYTMFFAIAIMFGIAGVSDIFAPVFYGEKFSYCSILMKGLSFAIPFTAFADVLRMQYLLPNNRDHIFIISLLCGAGINIVANYVLIPYYQAIGAVIGTILAEAVVCIIQTLYVKKYLPVRYYLHEIIPYFVNGFVMYLVVRQVGKWLKVRIITLIIQIILGSIIYLFLNTLYMKRKKTSYS